MSFSYKAHSIHVPPQPFEPRRLKPKLHDALSGKREELHLRLLGEAAGMAQGRNC